MLIVPELDITGHGWEQPEGCEEGCGFVWSTHRMMFRNAMSTSVFSTCNLANMYAENPWNANNVIANMNTC